jgi:predicted transcriptional regulator
MQIERFYPNRSGLRCVFGELELAVLYALWQAEAGAIDCATVHRRLFKGGYRRALTTIQTTLHRLVNKGIVERRAEPGTGRRGSAVRWVYTARYSHAQLVEELCHVVQGILTSLRQTSA